MRIYLLERIEDVGCDQASGFVVIAHSHRDARETVADQADTFNGGPMGEGAAAWLDAARSHVRSIGEAESPATHGIVLRDAHYR